MKLSMFALLGLAACGQSEIQKVDTSRIERLEKQINEMETKRIQRLLKDNFTATLMPSDKGYGVIQLPEGSVGVSFESIKPLANGSVVEIQFRNFTSAYLMELKFHYQWGGVTKEGYPEYTTAQEKDYSLPSPLPPGASRTFSIPLGNLKPSEFGFVELSKGTVGSVSTPSAPDV
jgi:hypothetical protein